MNATKVQAWAAQARRGASYVYHDAPRIADQVAYIRATKPTERNAADQAACNEAFDAWALYQAGLVTLVQRRVQRGLQYVAVRL
jgi:hypothetical protein